LIEYKRFAVVKPSTLFTAIYGQAAMVLSLRYRHRIVPPT